jgi:peptidoglycan/xylan/chitin deacetylase (PgdA/CDA1 family)
MLGVAACVWTVTPLRAGRRSVALGPAGVTAPRSSGGTSPAGSRSLEELLDRSLAVRERLLDALAGGCGAAPAVRGASRGRRGGASRAVPAAVLADYERSLADVAAAATGPVRPEPWLQAFLGKGFVLLSMADREGPDRHIEAAQTCVNALVAEYEPLVYREVAGVKVVTRGDASRRETALTLDGGPASATAELLDVLKAEGIKATFFLLGCFAQKDPVTCRRIAAEGHAVANHTMTHAQWKGLARIPMEAGDVDIREGARVIAGATGVTRLDLFRPPYGSGAFRGDVNQVIGRHHRYSIMWTIDTLDSMGAGLEKQIGRVLASSRLNGAIILAHDHSRHIVTLVRAIVPELKRRGYRFVTVPELLASGESSLESEAVADLCIDLQHGNVAECYRASLRAAAACGSDRLGREAADFAYVIARLYPGVAGTVDAVRDRVVRLFPRELHPPWVAVPPVAGGPRDRPGVDVRP